MTAHQPSSSQSLDFRSRLYASYVSGHLREADWSQAAPSLIHDVIARLPLNRSARVLDVGCGQGQLVNLLMEQGYTDVRGVDASEEQVALARKHGLTNIHRANLFDYLSDAPGPFDAVIAIDLLEHFEPADVLGVLDTLYAQLAPGGRIVIRTPNAEGPFSGRYRYWDFTHGTAFTQASIRQVLAATGFVQVEVYPQEPVAHGVVSFLRLSLWRFLASLVKAYLAVETGVVRGHIVTQNLIAVAERPYSPGSAT